MALEDLITKLIASIDANTAALKASKGAAATTASGGAATSTAGASDPKKAKAEFERLRVLGAKVTDKLGKPFAKKLILDVGGAKELAAVKIEKYPALTKAFDSALADTGDAEEAEEEDDDL